MFLSVAVLRYEGTKNVSFRVRSSAVWLGENRVQDKLSMLASYRLSEEDEHAEEQVQRGVDREHHCVDARSKV